MRSTTPVIFLLLITPSLADEKARFYQVRKDHVQPGITARALADGDQIGQVLPEVVDLHQKLRGTSELKEQLPILVEAERNISDQIMRRAAWQRTVLKERNPRAPSTPPGESAPPAPGNAPQTPVSLDLASFQSCARSNLLALKKRLLVELRRDENLRVSLDARILNPVRGDGTGVSPSGVICGAFLGRAGMPKPPLREEIKFLAAASRAEGEGFRTLLRAWVVAHHPRSPVRGHTLWSTLWKELSVRAAFMNAILPSLSDLRSQITSGTTTQLKGSIRTQNFSLVTLTVTRSLKNDERAFEDGLQFATEMLP